MARPRKEGMEYFPHDTDATGDEKVDSMRALFGNNGYAFYFILCERIYRTSEAELDISKPVLLKPLVKKLLLSNEEFDEMLDAAFELNLFSRADFRDRGVITSNGIKKRFKAVLGMRDRWRKNKETEGYHGENPIDNEEENPVENPEETPESKVKESKVLKPINECGEWFEQFWNLYPKKQGKTVAEKKFASYYKNKLIDFEKVMKGTSAYIEYIKKERARGFDRQYMDGSTYVNQQRWNDDFKVIEVVGRKNPEVTTLSKEDGDLFDRAYKEQVERNKKAIGT